MDCSLSERWQTRGCKYRVAVSDLVAIILHRLKSGDQWRMIPVEQYFKRGVISWNGVCYYFDKWCKDGSFQKVWLAVLQHHKQLLDLSSLQLDGSHTIAKKGGEAVGYQGRKKAKTTNMLFFTDKKMAPPDDERATGREPK